MQCSIARFKIETGGIDGSDNVMFELHWNDNQYTCKSIPNSVNHTCNSSSWNHTPITPTANAPFFMKVQYDSSNTSVLIKSINIETDNGELYAINVFCIPLHMNHTMSVANNEPHTSYNSSCDHWNSKIRYNAITIGGRFEILYIYFRNAIQHYVNSPLEGSVSPPHLTSIGFRMGSPGTGTSEHPFIINAIQWDQTFYQCNNLSGTDGNENYTCTPDSLICPAVKSHFWFSIYCPNSKPFKCIISEIIVKDETERVYHINWFCVSSYQYPGTRTTNTCGQGSNRYFTSKIELSNHSFYSDYWRATVGYYDVSLFSPNDNHAANNASIYEIPISDGTNVPLDCPQTGAPSNSPSGSPTLAPSQPSSSPTQAPSLAPTATPSVSPTNPCAPTSVGACIHIENPLLWQGEIGYYSDEFVVSFFGNLYWIGNDMLMASRERGVIGTISESDYHPRFTETFMVTNDRGLSVSVEINKVGEIAVKSWSLPIAFYSNVGDANGRGEWHYIDQISFHNHSLDEQFKIYAGDEHGYSTLHPFNLYDLMRVSLDGITYVSKAAGNAKSPTTSTTTTAFPLPGLGKDAFTSTPPTTSPIIASSTTNVYMILFWSITSVVLAQTVIVGFILRKQHQKIKKLEQIVKKYCDKNPNDNTETLELIDI